MSADARSWAAEHGAGLRARPVEEAEAEVRAAGLTPRTLAPDAVVTLEFRPDRVDLVAGGDGLVREVRAG